jgi:hypothetical protein
VSTPHPKLGNVPTQTVHRMHVPRKHCVYIYVYTGGAGTHARDTHGRTRAHGCTDHSITQTNLTTIPKPSQPTNATPTHPNALRPKPPTAASLFQDNRRVGAGSFVVPTSSRHTQGCAQGDASERCIERSSRAKTRQKALMALYSFRSTSGKRKSENLDEIRAELSVPEPLELTA